MRIDFYEKIFLGLTLVMLAAFMGAIAYASQTHGIHVPAPAGRVDPATVRTTPPFDNLGLHEVGPNEFEVNLIAGMWQFEPYFDKATEAIRIPTGAKVTFNLASPDVIHGFKVQGTDINVMVIPGQVSQVTRTFDEPGKYVAMCHEYCGAGHQLMYVDIIVGEEGAAAAPDDAGVAETAGEGGGS